MIRYHLPYMFSLIQFLQHLLFYTVYTENSLRASASFFVDLPVPAVQNPAAMRIKPDTTSGISQEDSHLMRKFHAFCLWGLKRRLSNSAPPHPGTDIEAPQKFHLGLSDNIFSGFLSDNNHTVHAARQQAAAHRCSFQHPGDLIDILVFQNQNVRRLPPPEPEHTAWQSESLYSPASVMHVMLPLAIPIVSFN